MILGFPGSLEYSIGSITNDADKLYHRSLSVDLDRNADA